MSDDRRDNPERELRNAGERLRRLLSVRPPQAHATLWRESVISAGRTLAEAARALLHPFPGRGVQTEAARAAFEALAVLAEFRDAAAAEELADLCVQMRHDPDPQLAAEVRLQELVRQAGGSRDRRTAGRLCGELARLLEGSVPEWRHLIAARHATRRLGDVPEAAGVYLEFAHLLGRSPHAAVTARAARFEGTARRLTLVGKAPEIGGTLAGGEPFSLEACRGKVVFVEFWATWCGPCRRELPTLKGAYARYRSRAFEVLGVSVDDDPDRLAAFLREQEIHWPVLFGRDPGERGFDHPLAVRYGVEGIPTGFLIGRDGRVVAIGVRATNLADLLPRLLHEESA